MLNLIFASFVFSAIISCGTAGPTGFKQGQLVRISEQTTCELVAPASCSGLYGFSIDNNRGFTAGPSPTGKTVQGNISSDEANTLSATVNAYQATVTGQSSCQPTSGLPGTSDLILMDTTTITQLQVFASNVQPSGTTCVSADAGQTSALVSYIQQLRTKYYPTPFPS